jgi:hypothetical protein
MFRTQVQWFSEVGDLVEETIVGFVHAGQYSPAQIERKRDTAASWALVGMLFSTLEDANRRWVLSEVEERFVEKWRAGQSTS